ncbi:MAG: hypothetical protein GXX96_35300 [Planctomycetaceae bacterium]|mgnify:CR=1 FL=1|nr:hypothetical protein [Planctomycetaceae bacterium]
MTRHAKKQRALERFRRKVERDPAGEIAKFFREMVRKGYTTSLEVEDFRRRMDAARTDDEATRIKTSFLLDIKARVKADPAHEEGDQ